MNSEIALKWLESNAPLAIWSGHLNGQPRVEILKTNGDCQIEWDLGSWIVLGGGRTLVEAVADAMEGGAK